MAKAKYDQTHKLEHLKFVTVIANRGQYKFYSTLFAEFECPFVLTTHGYGAASLVAQLFSAEAYSKTIYMGVIKESLWPALKKRIEDRFDTSKSAKGIAFTIPINAVAGVSIYKYLVNDRKLDKEDTPVTKIKNKIKEIAKKGGNEDGR